jgi:hypothetical protein
VLFASVSFLSELEQPDSGISILTIVVSPSTQGKLPTMKLSAVVAAAFAAVAFAAPRLLFIPTTIEDPQGPALDPQLDVAVTV